jgi:hypothetical protein
MRAVFLFLVLVNLGFFAWSRYLAPADAVVDPAPLGRQIEPDKLRILRPGEVPIAAAPRKPPAAPVASPPPAASTAPPVATAPVAVATCLEWGSFTVADAPKAEKVLEPLALGVRLGQRRSEELAAWWVFIPPQSTRQAALKKAAELKSLGVTEYFIVSDEGQFRWALSLGVFRTRDAAQFRLLTLREQGVRTARIGPRETLVPKLWLQVKGVDPALEARLKDIARQVEGSELKPCS